MFPWGKLSPVILDTRCAWRLNDASHAVTCCSVVGDRKYDGRHGLPTVGYDNERGKGDHKHIGELETPYKFESAEKLVADFLADVERATNEHDS